mmetsp:Transcript_82279/g.130087  ORF Transcript_82279/g.130087 Transcript_82279/m.130087 type:complete len:217 (+) Transcript_82279:561-1211(+)
MVFALLICWEEPLDVVVLILPSVQTPCQDRIQIRTVRSRAKATQERQEGFRRRSIRCMGYSGHLRIHGCHHDPFPPSAKVLGALCPPGRHSHLGEIPAAAGGQAPRGTRAARADAAHGLRGFHGWQTEAFRCLVRGLPRAGSSQRHRGAIGRNALEMVLIYGMPWKTHLPFFLVRLLSDGIGHGNFDGHRLTHLHELRVCLATAHGRKARRRAQIL